MNIGLKKGLFILVLVCIIPTSCTNKVTKNIEVQKKLTIEDIKANYTGGEKGDFVNMTIHWGKYALVEYTYDESSRWFDLYNLETGDKDKLFTGALNAKLDLFIDENNLRFITDGTHSYNGHKYFPMIVHFYREKEILGSEDDFLSKKYNTFLKIDEGIEMGVKENESITDVKATLGGFQILFQPIKGEEASFYAGYTTIPQFTTTYIKEVNQLVIEFRATSIQSKVKTSINDANRFIKAINISRNGQNTIFKITLTEYANYYTIGFSHLEPEMDDFPYLDFNFANDYKINY